MSLSYPRPCKSYPESAPTCAAFLKLSDTRTSERYLLVSALPLTSPALERASKEVPSTKVTPIGVTQREQPGESTKLLLKTAPRSLTSQEELRRKLVDAVQEAESASRGHTSVRHMTCHQLHGPTRKALSLDEHAEPTAQLKNPTGSVTARTAARLKAKPEHNCSESSCLWCVDPQANCTKRHCHGGELVVTASWAVTDHATVTLPHTMQALLILRAPENCAAQVNNCLQFMTRLRFSEDCAKRSASWDHAKAYEAMERAYISKFAGHHSLRRCLIYLPRAGRRQFT